MHKIFITLLFLLLAGNSVVAEELRDATNFFHDSFGDLSEEAEIAKSEGKTGVMIMFEENDCPWCRRMKERVLNRARVQDYFHNNFRVITLNVAGGTLITNFDGVDIMEKEFAEKYNRIRATPVFMFFSSEGKYLTRFTGTTKTVDEFLWLGEYVVTGEYKNGRFSTYKRNRLKKSNG